MWFRQTSGYVSWREPLDEQQPAEVQQRIREGDPPRQPAGLEPEGVGCLCVGTAGRGGQFRGSPAQVGQFVGYVDAIFGREPLDANENLLDRLMLLCVLPPPVGFDLLPERFGLHDAGRGGQHEPEQELAAGPNPWGGCVHLRRSHRGSPWLLLQNADNS